MSIAPDFFQSHSDDVSDIAHRLDEATDAGTFARAREPGRERVVAGDAAGAGLVRTPLRPIAEKEEKWLRNVS